MHTTALSLTALLAAAFSQAAPTTTPPPASYPDPEACSGVCEYVHDPYVLQDASGTYYRFVTFQDLQIATAPAMAGPWTAAGNVIQGSSTDPNDYWVRYVTSLVSESVN